MFNKLKAHGHTDLEKLIWMGLFVPGPNGRRGLPFVLVGDPGTRKTSLVKKLSKLAGLHFEGIIGSIREPTDFLGMPFFKKIILTPQTQHLSPDGDPDITVTGYAPAGFAVNAAMHRRAVIMLDEVSTCPPTVQAALLRLVLEGVCGEFELPPDVRFLLAMNETEDAAGGWNISNALANRLGWLRMEEPSVQLFSSYLMAGGGCRVAGKLVNDVKPVIDAKKEEAEVDARWAEAWATASGVMTGFLSAKSDALHRKPKKMTRDTRAWPSSRSHDFATCVLAGGEVYDLPARVVEMGVSAFIGAGTSGELHTWRRTADIPKAADFLDGKASFTHNPARFDRTSALIASCTSLVVNKNCENRPQRIMAMWKFLESLPEDCTDIAGGAVVSLAEARLMIGGAWQPTALKVLAKMEPVMTAAGITPDWTTQGAIS